MSQSPTCGKPTKGGPCVRVVAHDGDCAPAVSVLSGPSETVDIAACNNIHEWRLLVDEIKNPGAP